MQSLQAGLDLIAENPDATIRVYDSDLLNLIGNLIHHGKFDHQAAVVKYFTDDLRVSTFDEGGCLINWAWGLFSPRFSDLTFNPRG